MITEYDRRQVERMKQQLDRFDRDELDLSGLIGDLEFLLSAIESVPQDWKKDVYKEIGVFEEVYAVFLDRGHEELDIQSRNLVCRAVENLKDKLTEISV